MNEIYNSFGFLFAKVSQEMQMRAAKHLKQFHLTPKQLGLLLVLYENDGITQSRAGEIQRVDRTTVMQMTDFLERAGYVCRSPRKSDRRSYSLSLSKEGADLTEQLRQDLAEIQQEYLKPLQEDEIQTLKDLLLALVRRGGADE